MLEPTLDEPCPSSWIRRLSGRGSSSVNCGNDSRVGVKDTERACWQDKQRDATAMNHDANLVPAGRELLLLLSGLWRSAS